MGDLPREQHPIDRVDTDDLSTTLRALAPIQRPPCSAGEREAATWIAARLSALGCEVAVEEEQAFASYAPALAGLSALGLASAALALVGARRPATVLGAAAATAIADDVSNGPRAFRRLTMRQRPTWNVVARAGADEAPRTLVVLAHHDAAPTGAIFDSTLQKTFAERFPGLVERMDTSPPVWFPVVAGPALAAWGAWRGSRRALAAGAALSAGATAALTDIARSPTTPGANDNLTAVAGLVALAAALHDRPLRGLRVLLVSAGSEEALQGGMRAFAARHFAALDRDTTFFLNLETLGSPRLALLEGEGPLVMEDYTRLEFRDLVVRCAAEAGIPLRRGMRSRASTDAVVASRAGYPTATLVSVDRHKALSNYHTMADVPERVDLATVASAVALTERVARELATVRWPAS